MTYDDRKRAMVLQPTGWSEERVSSRPARPSEETVRVLIGQSARTRQLLRLIDKLGPARFPVLLIGETGTGKEVVARRLHQTNAAGPFVTIDCSAMVGPLMESELFGHVKGAFTGAANAKVGLIEAAHGGTAFFDEIGELPLDLQSKLLRVLQEREFRPVGSLIPRKSDFRIIAATNRDLAKEADKGNFRRDLYYRLNVVTVRLAPLRDRREDVPALLRHFLDQHGRQHTVAPEALEALLAYDWPGNVRELENCVQHMVAINSGPTIHMGDLPSQIHNFIRGHRSRPTEDPGPVLEIHPSALETPSPGAMPSPGAIPPPDQSPIIPLAEMERQAILRALEYTKGDRVMAAQLLGIGRTTLYRKLKEYGFDRL